MVKKGIGKNLIVGLDIGTSKIVALVGNVHDDNKIEIVGMGTAPSYGLKRGVVVDIESTVSSIQKAVREAENSANCQIHSAYAGIAGSHIRCLNSYGMVPIERSEVTQEDVNRVMESARAVAISADQKIIHALPQEFIIDSQPGIRDPLGMSGIRLEAKVHLITSAISATQNITKCMQSCGLAINDVVLEQLASSYSVLMEDEKDLGVCLIDIGAGTTDIAVFTQKAIRFNTTLPIAGEQITNDIAVALRTPTNAAEEIKRNFARAQTSMTTSSEVIDVPSVGDRPSRKVSQRLLAEVCEARYVEIFDIVKETLRHTGFEKLVASGAVITGGAAKLPGVIELAEKVLKMPVRLGVPEQKLTGMKSSLADPIYATSIGLLLHGFEQQQSFGNEVVRLSDGVKGMWRRMVSWFQGNF